MNHDKELYFQPANVVSESTTSSTEPSMTKSVTSFDTKSSVPSSYTESWTSQSFVSLSQVNSVYKQLTIIMLIRISFIPSPYLGHPNIDNMSTTATAVPTTRCGHNNTDLISDPTLISTKIISPTESDF